LSGGGYAVVSNLGVGFGMLAIALDTPAQQEVSGSEEERAATLRGGVHLGVSQHPPIVAAIAAPPWWVCRVVLDPEFGPRRVKNALPKDIPLMKHVRQAALAAGLALAFERQDIDLLRSVASEAIVYPALAPLLAGCFPAHRAAEQAGAALCGLSDRRGALAALCETETIAELVAAAVTESLALHQIRSEAQLDRIAPLVPAIAS